MRFPHLPPLAITLLLVLWGCDGIIDQVTPQPQGNTASGQWAYAGGTSEPTSPRNDAYTFEVTGTGTPITLSLEVDEIDGGLYVYDGLGERVRFTTGRRNLSLDLSLDAGTYRVVACGERGRPSRYTLRGTGISRGFTRITPSELAVSGQPFTVSGGQETTSPRNPTFTFEVTENNAWVDLVAESDDGDIGLYLYNPLGQRVRFTSGRRSLRLLERLSPGTHTAIVTGPRSLIGDIDLNIVGSVRSLSRVSFRTLTKRATVSNSNPLRYSFTVTESSTVDLAVDSPNGDARLELYDSTNQRVRFSSGRSPWFIRDVNPGAYTALVRPNSSGSGSLGIDLTVVGKIRE